MALDNIQFKLESHAYERYCERVAPVSKTELISKLKEDLKKGHRFRKGYLLIGETWWRAGWEGKVITLFTCYGRTHIDIPQAVKWAKMHRDRLRLGSYTE